LPLSIHALVLVLFTFFGRLNPTTVRWMGEYNYLIYFVWAFISVNF